MKMLVAHSKRVLTIFLAAVLLFLLIPAITLQNNTVSATAGRRMGAWWWYREDATNVSTRETYLTYLEKAGVNEIYYYDEGALHGNAAAKEKLHTFVQAAMSHGMRISLLTDDAALVTNAEAAEKKWASVAQGFKEYFAIPGYENDAIYGIHYDGEAFGHPDDATMQQYLENIVIKATEALHPLGLDMEVDVNPCNWRAPGVYLDANENGEKDEEDINGFFNCLAYVLSGKGTISLMSYRLTAPTIVGRANEGGALDSCAKYNCAFTCGIEMGNGSNVGNSAKTKSEMGAMIGEVFDILYARNAAYNCGVTIHHARSYAALSDEIRTTTITTTETNRTETLPVSSDNADDETCTTTITVPTATETNRTGILPALLGDADQDGSVDMKDVLLLRKYLANLVDSVDMCAADVNRDGYVNMKDVLILRKFLAGLLQTLDGIEV